MKKPVLVVVEMDEDYLIPLEIKLAFAVGKRVSIEILSSEEALHTYFSKSQSIDVLLIDEHMYAMEDLQKHNIKKTYVLVEEITDNKTFRPSGIPVFKYSNLTNLIGMVLPEEWRNANTEKRKGQIIGVLSPIGGAGCTSIALGVAGALADMQRRVLYINSQQLQDFQFYLKNREPLPIEATKKFKNSLHVYSDLKELFLKERFDYLPELPSSKSNLAIEAGVYSQIAVQAAESQDYDFIIVDIGTEINTEEQEFLESAEKILIIVNQDAYSEYKVSILRRVLNYSDLERFTFVCNKFKPQEKNCFADFGFRTNRVVIGEYIEKNPHFFSAEELSTIKEIQKIGMAMF